MADKDPSKFPTLPSKVKRPLNPVSEFESELAALKAEETILINFQHTLLQRKKALMQEHDKILKMQKNSSAVIDDEPVYEDEPMNEDD